MELTGACFWGRAGSRAGQGENWAVGQSHQGLCQLHRELQSPLEVVPELSKGAGPLHSCVNVSLDMGWGGAKPRLVTSRGTQL